MVAFKAEEYVFRLAVPAKLEYREVVLRAVDAACERSTPLGGLSGAARGADGAARAEAFRHEITSALAEAINNIVLHAYGEDAVLVAASGREPQIEVEVETSAEALTVRFFDTGRSFEMADVPSPDLDALPEGGLGLFIMRAFVDELTYEAKDETNRARNVMTLKKAWPSGEALISSPVHRSALDASARGALASEPPAPSAATSDASGPSNQRESGRSGWRIRRVSPAAPLPHPEGRIAGIKRK